MRTCAGIALVACLAGPALLASDGREAEFDQGACARELARIIVEGGGAFGEAVPRPPHEVARAAPQR